MCRPRIHLGLFVGLLLVPSTVNAQSVQARKDSLRQLREDIAADMGRIHYADSIGDAKDAARWRIMLAPLCKRSEALGLYEEAALIADTAELDGDEELRAHQGLMGLYKATGNWRRAYEEAERTIELSAQFNGRQEMHLVHLERMNTSAMVGERDWAMNALNVERAKFDVAMRGIQEWEERSKWIPWLSVGACLLMLVLLLFLLRRERTRYRAEIAVLRAEVAAIKEAPKNRFREPVPTVVVEPPPAEAPQFAPIEAPAVVDAAALAIFRRMAPERLEVLNDARGRDDHEKVLRVVHTLKPHLEALDPNGLGALCLRIKAMDIAERDIELDRLTRGVQELLG